MAYPIRRRGTRTTEAWADRMALAGAEEVVEGSDLTAAFPASRHSGAEAEEEGSSCRQ
jgi:hypothetical protein